MRKFYTSESVFKGHPDKVCDQISDAILDAILEKDEHARVACEVLVSTGLVFISGEITTKCYVDIDEIARKVVKDIGYTRGKYGFDYETCSVLTSLKAQSPDIAAGVDSDCEESIGAGDQGIVFGYATSETANFMPLSVNLAQELSKNVDKARQGGKLPYLRPDGKAQVTLEYDGKKAKRVASIIISAQHSPEISQEAIKNDLINEIIKKTVPNELLDENTEYYINPTGIFVIGGPKGDVGLTGRKIIVDTYGSRACHGGGAFSGKDPTKTDRSGAYAARYVAKNVVAAGLASEIQVSLAYAIGVDRPISVEIECYGTNAIDESKILDLIYKNFDLRPGAIIKNMQLRRPIYRDTATYGHFGRDDLNLPWEKLDKVEILKKEIS